jgi:hypothetical protein
MVKRLGILAAAGAIGTLVAMSACTAFGDCVSDRIDASMGGANLELNGTPTFLTLVGTVTPGNVNPGIYNRLVGALIDGSESTVGAAWTLDQGFPQPGWLSMVLGVEALDGDTITVTQAATGGGWGFLDAPGTPLLVSFKLGDFQATAAAGTAVVLDAAPLNLRLNLALANGDGDTILVQGDMVFRRTREDVSCS